MSQGPNREKLYVGEIGIDVKPYSSLFPWGPRWKAESGLVDQPYKDWGCAERYTAYGKTAEEAANNLKNKLCKITAREEEQHAKYREWQGGIKQTTFSRERDCNPVMPRPKSFS